MHGGEEIEKGEMTFGSFRFFMDGAQYGETGSMERPIPFYVKPRTDSPFLGDELYSHS